MDVNFPESVLECRRAYLTSYSPLSCWLHWLLAIKGTKSLSLLDIPNLITQTIILSDPVSATLVQGHPGPYNRCLLGQAENVLYEFPISLLFKLPCSHLQMVPAMNLWRDFSHHLAPPSVDKLGSSPLCILQVFPSQIFFCILSSLCLHCCSSLQWAYLACL